MSYLNLSIHVSSKEKIEQPLIHSVDLSSSVETLILAFTSVAITYQNKINDNDNAI